MIALLTLALQLESRSPPPSPDVSTLVARARAARLQQDAQLASYEVITRQRMSSSIGLAGGITVNEAVQVIFFHFRYAQFALASDEFGWGVERTTRWLTERVASAILKT